MHREGRDTLDAPVRIDPEPAHLALMEEMLFARRASERLLNLQRQGRVVTFPPIVGQEAAVVGVMHSFDLAHDWAVPSYRELVGLGALGDEFLEQVVSYWRGHPDGARIPDGVRCLPPQIALAAQLPHAVGLAWGLRHRGERGVVYAFFGDGATSEGDFYEAINLAGVVQAPVIFVCINNGWAISTPAARQTAADSFAAKAGAAGFVGVRVDGNDVLAVARAAADARATAEGGGGPALLELVTYRVGPHTNADDPSRYVPLEELTDWMRRDPIDRFAEFLRQGALWDDDAHAEMLARVDARLERIVTRALDAPVSADGLFDHLYATRAPRLERQRRDLQDRVRGS